MIGTTPTENVADVVLYSYETCPYSQRVQIALHEKGVEYRKINVSLAPAEEWFQRISPYGEVPVLKLGEAHIPQSTAINEYLDEAYPGRPLLPADISRRAEARFWISTCDGQLMPACHALIRDRRDEEKQKINRDRVDVQLIRLSKGLEQWGGPYWLGSEFSLVDATFAPFIERYACYQEVWGARWPAEASALRSWWAAVQVRDSVASTLHDHAFHLEVYRRYDAAP